MSKRDYYEVLHIEKDANADQIKKAFRKKAMKYHPDKNEGDKASEDKFKEINEAYEVLGNAEKRERYDRFGHAGVDPNAQGFGGGGGFGGGFDDIFGDIFDMFGGGSSSARRNGPRKGADIKQEVDISFEESAFGVSKEIKINRLEVCDQCDGTGAKEGTSKKTCPECKGTGEVRFQQRTPFGQFVNVKPCDRCGGEGSIIEDPCNQCRGKGKVRKNVTVKVDVPAGVDRGSVLSLRGEGQPGEKGGPSGDLYVILNIQPHEIFEREGYDLVFEMPISFVQASLGDEVIIPSLEGKIKYKIPEATQSGTVFRIKGKGIQHLNGYGKGDMYVKVYVEVPKNLSDRQKDILKKFSSEMGEEIKEQSKNFFDKVKDVLGV